MTAENLKKYSVSELNASIGTLLKRGFAPRFLLDATISKAQLKKGHLWLTLTDGEASITAVAWSSVLQNLTFRPNESDGVLVIGKLNFWEARASLVVQVLDIRPSISTVLRKFEINRDVLTKEGVIDDSKRKVLPEYPETIALLTSVPSSAMADMIRTAKERWPFTKILLIPIPVQGDVARQISYALKKIIAYQSSLKAEAIVLARGGGSREDLMVFDDEDLCRDLANCPIPLITGIGHEDDLTVADLVADYRASTPTGAIVALLPSRESALSQCLQSRKRFDDKFAWYIRKEKQHLLEKARLFKAIPPLTILTEKKKIIHQKYQLLRALSPDRWLGRGFAIVRNELGQLVSKVEDVQIDESLTIQLGNGHIKATVINNEAKELSK